MKERIYTHQIGCKVDEETYRKMMELCGNIGVRKGVLLKALVEFLVNNLKEVKKGTKISYLHLATDVLPVPVEQKKTE